MIHVTASIEVKPGKDEEMIAALASVVGLTRQEEGCVEYNLHRSSTHPQKYLMIEIWKSQEALDSHLNAPYIQDLFAAAGSLLDAPIEISMWTRVNL